MADLETLKEQLIERQSEEKEAVVKFETSMRAAHAALGKFLRFSNEFTRTVNGTATAKRCNRDRTIQFVELTDESGVTLRIEVYVK